jgi:3-hydroxyisobutyrate dehydrogenase
MKIAIIGCGEVGGAYARALNGKADLALCDIVSTGRPAALSAELGIPLNSAPGEWLTECDIAITAVQGSETGVAAESVLPWLAPQALYIDVGTGAPDEIRQWSRNYAEKQRAFVDTAIIGSIPIHGGAAPVMLAGSASNRAKEIFGLMGAHVKMLPDSEPGDAVALKLLRSVITKGLECLAVESLTAAEHLGIRDGFFEALGDLDASPIADFMDAMVTSHVLHAKRRRHEMQESAAQLRELGFDATITAALEQRYAATLALRDRTPPPDDAHETLDKSLAWLMGSTRTIG